MPFPLPFWANSDVLQRLQITCRQSPTPPVTSPLESRPGPELSACPSTRIPWLFPSLQTLGPGAWLSTLCLQSQDMATTHGEAAWEVSRGVSPPHATSIFASLRNVHFRAYSLSCKPQNLSREVAELPDQSQNLRLSWDAGTSPETPGKSRS